MLALSISNLNKGYNKVSAVCDLSIDIKEGEFFALLGPNGAGKSTTINIICSLLKKDSGIVRVLGYDLDHNLTEAKGSIGLVPQEFNFSIFETPFDILVNQAGYYGINKDIASKRAEKYLDLLGLLGKRNAKAGRLSGGMKRRLMIARAMMHEPKILILDEPTAGVDIEVRRHIWSFLQTLNKQGKTIILTTHYLEEAERLCNTVAIIDMGKIIRHDSMRNIFASQNKQKYIAELVAPITFAPVINGFEIKLTDPFLLEVGIITPRTVSQLIIELAKHCVEVKSLSAQSNRLEELFLELTTKVKS